eukprot:scaffold6655_cov169-Amphora_coffeaeformis.AAC.16
MGIVSFCEDKQRSQARCDSKERLPQHNNKKRKNKQRGSREQEKETLPIHFEWLLAELVSHQL